MLCQLLLYSKVSQLYIYIYSREGTGNPLQDSCLENPRDGGDWWAAIYGVAQSQTRQKGLSSSSSIHIFSLQFSLPFRSPGRLPCTILYVLISYLFYTQQCIYVWRRQWHPTPVLLPGESQGRWSLMGCRLWGRTESDTTEATQQKQQQQQIRQVGTHIHIYVHTYTCTQRQKVFL